MPHKLEPTDEYKAIKLSLSPNARAALQLVETGIADDPYHRVARYEDPSGIVVDFSADNLAVSYYALADGDVVLLDVAQPAT